MKKHLSTILLLLIFFVGAAVMIYPSFSNWWNNNKATHVIADYNAIITKVDTSEIDAMWEAAEEFNNALSGTPGLPEEKNDWYNSVLNATGTGIIGYVDIPSIRVSLPIYHGTSDTVLQVGIGHIDWSSLPTGQESTHVVISGHRGLPSARLFTDIDSLTVGDTFSIEVLNKEFTYEVDNIAIVLPEELEFLKITPGEEYCTLVTCTPYGVNSHRLLVRGHLVEGNNSLNIRVTADALQIRPVVVAPFVAAPLLVILLIMLFTAPAAADEDDENYTN